MGMKLCGRRKGKTFHSGGCVCVKKSHAIRPYEEGGELRPIVSLFFFYLIIYN